MRIFRFIVLFPLVYAASTFADEGAAGDVAEPARPMHASAALKATSGSQVAGTVSFTETTSGVQVVAEVSGLTPGKHGFHVHEKGDCSDPEGKSAGGHFNPGGTEHGAPDADVHHAGDLGNLMAGEDGNARLEAVFEGVSLSGDDGLIGRGLIVHADPDDLSSQPTGNAGARVACAVIEAAP